MPLPTLTPRQVRTAVARRVLAAAGLLEAVTFSFMHSVQAARFGSSAAALLVQNPIAADLDQMRPTPVATLALAAGRNAARGLPDALLFEVGPAYAAEGDRVQQQAVAAGVLAGHTPRHPLAPSRAYGAMDAKAAALDGAAALGVPMESAVGDRRRARLVSSGPLGRGPPGPEAGAGHVRRAASVACWPGWTCKGRRRRSKCSSTALPEPKRRRKATPDLPAFQPVRRDFAFLVPQATPVDAILRAARGAERTLIAGVSLFDVYEGDKLPAGQKSVGIEVVLQPRERTLTDAEIEAAAAKVVAAVAKATGATLR